MPRRKNNKKTPQRKLPKRNVTVRVKNNTQPNLQMMPVLSPCARDYARALINPFGSFVKLPCIPDVIALPSFKMRTMSRGLFSIGTGGVGYIAVNPYQLSNQTRTATVTDATFTGTTFITAGAGINAVSNDSPYADDDYANKEARLVGAGVRIRYTGTELNRGGRVILFRSPFNGVIPSGATASVLLGYRTTSTAPVTRRREFVTYQPDNPLYLGYNDPFNLINATESLLIYVDGAKPGESFEFEIVQYFEIIGAGIPATTQSHSDPSGMGSVMASIPEKVPTSTPEVAERKVLNTTTQNLMHSLSGFLPIIGKGISTLSGLAFGPTGAALGSAVGNMLMGGTNGPLIEDYD